LIHILESIFFQFSRTSLLCKLRKLFSFLAFPTVPASIAADLVILAIACTVTLSGEWLWVRLDQQVPDWDQADYLTGALNYLHYLQTSFPVTGSWGETWGKTFGSSQWWEGLWLLSSKIPPLAYLLGAGWMAIAGRSSDTALGVNAIALVVLTFSTYGLGLSLSKASGDQPVQGERSEQRSRQRVALIAALLTLVLPGTLAIRRIFLLDYSLCAIVALEWWLLTGWKRASDPENLQTTGDRVAWFWPIGVGLAGGAALMLKQTALLFFVVPCGWLLLRSMGQLLRRSWQPFAQICLAVWVSSWLWGGWYRTNWLLILTASKRASIDSAAIEGDPSLLNWQAWTYYPGLLPEQTYAFVLVLAGAGLLGAIIKRQSRQKSRQKSNQQSHPRLATGWLLLLLGGAYCLGAINPNKDPRYILPVVSALAIALAWGLAAWRGRVVGLTIALMAGLNISQSLPTAAVHSSHTHAYVGQAYPHAQAIATLQTAAPWERITLGVLPSTATVNQHNLNLYGALAGWHVYGRQVGVRSEDLAEDVRSVHWFALKTGDQGLVPATQATIAQFVRESGEFTLLETLPLPDGDRLELYQRRDRDVQVLPEYEANQNQRDQNPQDQNPSGQDKPQDKPGLPGSKPLGSHSLNLPNSPNSSAIELVRVELPSQASPGAIVPVTYHWHGKGEALQGATILLSWHPIDTPASSVAWLHDRAIASGNFAPNFAPINCDQGNQDNQDNRGNQNNQGDLGNLGDRGDRLSCNDPLPVAFKIRDHTAFKLPNSIPSGRYQLTAIALDQQGQAQRIAQPIVTFTVAPPPATPTAIAPPNTATIQTVSVNRANTANLAPAITPAITPAIPIQQQPPLDLNSQIRELAPLMRSGFAELETVFTTVARMNQYDPTQDYLDRTIAALEFRLQSTTHTPEQAQDWAYTIALAQLLKKRISLAIPAFERVAQLDATNAYAHAYLAAVETIGLRWSAARVAIDRAIALQPSVPEFYILRGALKLLRGNAIGAYQDLTSEARG